MFYYAYVGYENRICRVDLIRESETDLGANEELRVRIYSNDTSIIRKYYDYINSTFENPIFLNQMPLYQIKDHSTADIAMTNENVLLTQAIQTIRTNAPTLIHTATDIIPAGSAPLVVDVAEHITDGDTYSYLVEIIRSVNAADTTDMNLPIQAQVHTGNKTVVFGRFGVAASKAVSVTYRLIKFKI